LIGRGEGALNHSVDSGFAGLQTRRPFQNLYGGNKDVFEANGAFIDMQKATDPRQLYDAASKANSGQPPQYQQQQNIGNYYGQARQEQQRTLADTYQQQS